MSPRRAAGSESNFCAAQARQLRFGAAAINFAGVDYQRFNSLYLVGAEQLVAPGAVNILLSHNPDVFPVAAAQGYDLTIAGHTHGGQVDVEILHQHFNVARYFTPYVLGLYREGASSVYVSSGIGTIGVPIRLGAPPESISHSPVRYLILSDIHGNWEALQAVLARARSEYDSILCCGDLVGYGADPDAVTEWVRDNVASVVRGNHDKAAAGLEDLEWFNPVAKQSALWTQAAMKPENLAYLRDLTKGPEQVNGFQILHGSPLDEDEYVVTEHDVAQLAPYLDSEVSFFGHTHLQGGFLCHRNGVDDLSEACMTMPGPNHRAGERRQLSDQSRFGGAAARWRSARRLCRLPAGSSPGDAVPHRIRYRSGPEKDLEGGTARIAGRAPAGRSLMHRLPYGRGSE